jgi:hypothetical protein
LPVGYQRLLQATMTTQTIPNTLHNRRLALPDLKLAQGSEEHHGVGPDRARDGDELDDVQPALATLVLATNDRGLPSRSARACWATRHDAARQRQIQQSHTDARQVGRRGRRTRCLHRTCLNH